MDTKLYWKQKLPMLLLHVLCMIGLASFLRVTGNGFESILFLLLIWITVLTVVELTKFYKRRNYLNQLLALAENMDERYLLSEVMERPERADDRVYYRLLKLAGKSMLEQVAAVGRERAEYREYVERWVHEMKTPITAIRLLGENNRSQMTKELLAELEKISRYTEQALYYARSEHTEKDYFVRELSLSDVIHQAIAENKYLLLQNGVRIGLEETDDIVCSDEKWLRFILNQLIVNAVKYRTAQPALRFYTERVEGETVLCVEDNGVGIDAGDLPRIFEPGFTGINGREVSPGATGMGLYLCRRLCDRLGIGICAGSDGSGTTVRLSFPVNGYLLHDPAAAFPGSDRS